MAYAILRFSKRKAGGVAGADRHNERKKQSYKSNPDIDTGRTKNNYHLVKPSGTYKSEYTRLIKEAGCKVVRKDSVVLVETLLTASPEFLSAMNGKQQREFLRGHSASLRKGSEKKISYQPWCIWTNQCRICTFLFARSQRMTVFRQRTL